MHVFWERLLFPCSINLPVDVALVIGPCSVHNCLSTWIGYPSMFIAFHISCIFICPFSWLTDKEFVCFNNFYMFTMSSSFVFVRTLSSLFCTFCMFSISWLTGLILVSSGKAAMCTGAEVDWNLIDSDHAGVKLWLDVRKIKWDRSIAT